MSRIHEGILNLGDVLLAALLSWPRDVALVVVAASVTILMLAARSYLLPADRIRRVTGDERRLKMLIRDARQRADDRALARHRIVRRLVALERLKLELVPAVIGLIPATLLTVWGTTRLAHQPLQPDEQFEFSITVPVSLADSVAHIVPAEGLDCAEGWIRVVEADHRDEDWFGAANWSLRAAESVAGIIVRVNEQSWNHRISSGRGMTVVEIQHPGSVTTRVLLALYRPFGVIPGVPLLGIPPCLVGLLLLTLVGYFGGRRILKLA